MWLTRLALHRPLMILMFAAALALLGIRALFNMPAELNPRVDVPLITVLTVYPGASPEQVESVVTEPIEDSVGAMSGLEAIKSTSQEGLSVVEIQLQIGQNLDAAASSVRQSIETARQNFPQGVYQPLVYKEDINAAPVLIMGLMGNRTPTELRRIADEEIKPVFGRIEGVASVDVTGGNIEEIHVDLDRNKLAAYGLSPSAVAYSLQKASLDVPAGSVQQSGRNYSIRMVGQFTSLAQIRAVGLPGPPAAPGNPSRTVTVGDVATVTRTIQAPTRITRVDLKPSVGISVVKGADANTVQVAEAVRKQEKLLQPNLKKLGVTLVTNEDQSVMIQEALSDITSSLVLGALLATLVVYIFLHDLRGTLIIGCAIPTSLVVTFLVMHTAHFTLNQMTMLGLSIAVGILVDDSILVLENIYRHLQRGEPPMEAAFSGRTEIGLADITTTLVDVVVFVPIAFMGGIVGQFFKQFGLTVATATLTSMFVSFSFTPMLASRWYRSKRLEEEYSGFAARFNRFYDRLDSGYRRLLAWALARRLAVIGMAVAALGIALTLGALGLRFEFIPTVDQGRIQVTVEMPPSATLDDTNRLVSQVEQVIWNDKDVRSVFTTIGEMSGGGWRVYPLQGPAYAELNISLYEKPGFFEQLTGVYSTYRRRRSDEDIALSINQKLSKIPGARINVMPIRGVEGATAPVEIDLYGRDMMALQSGATAIANTVAAAPGAYDVQTSLEVGRPEIQVTPDRARMADLGVSVDALGGALRTAFAGSTDSRFLDTTTNKTIVVRVQDAAFNRSDVNDVSRVLVSRDTGPPVTVGEVATVAQTAGPSAIDRKGRQRMVVVVANLRPGYALGDVTQSVGKALARMDLPAFKSGAVTWEWGGDAKQMRTQAVFMAAALLTSIALVYMLMAALFNSMLHPLTIMLSLPMALVGAIVALVLAGTTLSIVAMIGFIMLVGMVGKNAILLVDYTNTLRARGRTTTQALLEAGPTRLRPILMTTLTVVTGMLPTALGIGRASEMRAPMAIAVLGGLILSTLLTLVVIPVCYSLFDDVFRKL